jgi:RNA polymerase sigma-70 factor (ECF subfamily)
METTRLTLLQRVRDLANQGAWKEFVALYRPLLLRYLRARVRAHHLDEADLADILQNIFIKLSREMPRFSLDPERGRFRSYLWRVAMSVFLDHVRQQRHSSGAQEGPGPAEQLLAESPDEEWGELYRANLLTSILARLRDEIAPKAPQKWRSFEEYAWKGRPAKEVAAELGISTALVYQNASRVLALARSRCLAEYGEDLSG